LHFFPVEALASAAAEEIESAWAALEGAAEDAEATTATDEGVGENRVSPATGADEVVDGDDAGAAELAGEVLTVPHVPVIPAPAFGVVPAYEPPYRTFLPGLGKTTAMFSIVAHPGAASTLATKGAGKDAESRPNPPLVMSTGAQFWSMAVSVQTWRQFTASDSHISRLPCKLNQFQAKRALPLGASVGIVIVSVKLSMTHPPIID
jgi:hypothetical protein